MGNELTIESIKSMATLADAFYASGLFPDIKSQAQAIVKIQAGAELGFAPIYSMQKVYIVQGKIVLAAEAMGALVKKSGRYDYVATEYDDTKVTLAFTDKGKLVFTSTFTMDDARKAGLLKPGSGWEKFPRAMLMSKALSQGARIVCPEVIAGVYTFEDIGLETTDEGELKEPPKVTIDKPPAEPATMPQEVVKSPNLAAQPPKQAETTTGKRDTSKIKTIGDLFNACKEDFNELPDFVVKDLGYKTRTDISDPKQAYETIAELHRK